MHRASHRFWDCFNALPPVVQQAALASFALLKADASHPSLHFKKIGSFWSVRVTISYRALAVKDGDDFIWVWIGTHDDYERMIGP